MPASRSACSISGQTFRCASRYSSIFSGRTPRTKALRSVMSEARVGALDRRGSTFLREPFVEAAGTERRNGVGLEAEVCAEAREQRARVRLERLDEDAVRSQDVACQLCLGEARLVDEQRLCVCG